jgi:hypothetical protein
MAGRILDAVSETIEVFRKHGLPPPAAIALGMEMKGRLEMEASQLDAFPFKNPGLPTDPKIKGVPIRFEQT